LLKQLHDQLSRLGGTLNHFIQSVESQHQSVREEGAQYTVLEEAE
jgi:hypothetical protein